MLILCPSAFANADGDKNSANNFVLRPACTIFAIESEYRQRSLSVKINFHPLACTIFAKNQRI